MAYGEGIETPLLAGTVFVPVVLNTYSHFLGITMKYSLPLIALLSLSLGLLLFRPGKVAFIKDDAAYLSVLKQVREDSVYREAREKNILTLQGKIDSLSRLAKRLQAMPLPALDSVAHIKSVKRDSLICTDEKTYRSLVISSLNFGEQKYSLCLGQVAEKDSIIQSFNTDLSHTILVASELNEGKKAITLQLESVKHTRTNWFLTGVGIGIAGSLALYFAAGK